MTPITLHPHEVRASLAGRLGVIVRPLKPKREGWEFQGLNVHGQALFYPVGDLTPETEAEYEHWDGLMPPPIPEGPFWGRETWADNPCSNGLVSPKGEYHPWGSPIYKATFGAGLIPVCEGFSPWRSPVTMPRKYSRITGTVTGSRVCRVGDVSLNQWAAWGIDETVTGQPDMTWADIRASAVTLWNATYRNFDANPWVQVARIERSAS